MDLFWRRDYYSKLRADSFTIPAVNALAFVDDSRQSIALGIDVIAHLEHIPGAKINTEATALASLLVYGYLAPGCGFRSI